ncbi:GIY-YIG nuclease family protein [Clostridium luticellarii]|jgi:putative endonuclease|uniref:GIY-YIG nuclease superfamily protein n=1 Tax=Clostridium luticellarii TaxID=1691940 RepID=A0A2T0BK39_9CLOT|nr:GIY-YIG nuclease family protein [Clostridium luticellarii]MCI1944935.1 GIY-YIG nuclease family protein [Clostridium luticellarii]MCI1968389.1 GIY-YIG nuclease family protein [Clostridium luticellarii]MCI1995387.1 GIY-YIG nuclease family protein [Clostridium luticellarii]MCI2039450.1 GIY-YIG nuclease family protein [Clostridium luticellarii]PRR84239.1 GIY-YIG nuclease superfamily protein [Clostridium luticellarii]
MNYVYILKCRDGTFYTGYTNNLKKRIKTHNSGKGAKYTRGRIPVKLVYFEEYTSKKEALHREYVIKKMTHEDKFRLIKSLNLENAVIKKL